MELINGVTCIKGEIHSILTLLRLLSLSSSSFDEQLRQSFRSLSESLEGKYCLIELDCMLYFKPFTDVITSPHANGTLTLASLSALCKFATYNFLRGNIPNIDMGVNCIADCIANCVFEESDKESDEVILLKVKRKEALLLLCTVQYISTTLD